MAANQQMIVAGEQIPVLQVADADLFQRMTAAQMTDLLGWAGYVGDQIVAETIQAMTENGYDLPRAWAEVRREDLLEIGIGPGYVPEVTSKQEALAAVHPILPHRTTHWIRGGLIALGAGWLH